MIIFYCIYASGLVKHNVGKKEKKKNLKRKNKQGSPPYKYNTMSHIPSTQQAVNANPDGEVLLLVLLLSIYSMSSTSEACSGSATTHQFKVDSRRRWRLGEAGMRELAVASRSTGGGGPQQPPS